MVPNSTLIAAAAYTPAGRWVGSDLDYLEQRAGIAGLSYWLIYVFIFLFFLLWLYNLLLGLGRFFRFLILYTVDRTRTGDQPVARPLPKRRTAQTQNKRAQKRHPCLQWYSNPRCQPSSEDISCLRPRGHCDRRVFIYISKFCLPVISVRPIAVAARSKP
jgi:hypothetical protein